MRAIPDPGFAGDDGAPDPTVRAALEQHARDLRSAPVLVALAGSRLIVPLVAMRSEEQVASSGLQLDKTSDMAAVLLTGRDGRRALLAFTGIDSLAQWQSDARPVPVSVQQAATAASQEGAAALVIDVAGPVPFALEGEDLVRTAAGDVLIPVLGGHAWRPQTTVPASDA